MNTLESITKAIISLSLENKKQLLEILEQQIFELEEASYTENQETIKDIKFVEEEYNNGEYLTLEKYIEKRSKN
ncbi:hypothetical protein [Geminocystis sp. GBBB08]|uniref:hypothetical protein n=1 Tax=Geminocystis sp. GBBB08 TaxID=2604140 RepID=UPI0027E25640|nr:hypothetical protein [Geminocystis sp. GBBB08]MBL1209480.1 hypothetical protein [Geminocystis sp. GBBB08]